ncbi:MAG: ribonucleotide-diphosphate reductase subunit beta [Gammaproteobacteria bacterium]|nr:ribonucleotide-diphosphate reductase subunit beta [Gammaproteobacteria bacterium]
MPRSIMRLKTPLEPLPPIRASDKRVVRGPSSIGRPQHVSDVNQLAPFKYPWAWDTYLRAQNNRWLPTEVGMGQDILTFKTKLSEADRHTYLNTLSFLSTADIMAMRNIGLAIMEKVTAPEITIYQSLQVQEEGIHTWTYQHCIESLNLDQGEIYNRYRVIPEIHQKIAIANERLHSVLRADIDLTDRDSLHDFLMAYSFFAAVFEGAWFYNGFTPVFALARRGLMTNTAEQFQYILRDEVEHAKFGINVVNEIVKEEGVALDPKAFQQMWEECEAAEDDYIRYVLPVPMVGYSASQHIEQFRYLANVRSRALNMKEPFPGAQNILTWLEEMSGGTRKEKNFFETRVTEYQSGGSLNWDDDPATPAP